MEINWLGRAAFRIKAREATVVTDPYDNKVTGYTLARPTADIVTVSHSDAAHANVGGVGGSPRVLEGPGEFEVAGASVVGVTTWRSREKTPESGKNIVFAIELEGLHVTHLGSIGHVPTSDQLEEIGTTDILLVPVGGGESLDAALAAETVSLIEPKLVIPMTYRTDVEKAKLDPVDRFLKEMGAKSPERHAKVTVTKSSLPEETQVVVVDYRK
jgi:L-ascorbate metabolism protein UlaG (beta-lactamase superfamily)